jgi:putative membrane protein
VFENFFKGILIGISNVIPGVSGGTIVFILGIYDFLTEAIANYFSCSWTKRKEYTIFLLQIGIGVITGIVLFAKLIEYMYINYPEQTSFFFIGLILLSIPIILKDSGEKLKTRGGFSFCFGFFVILLLINLEKLGISNGTSFFIGKYYYAKLFLCGAMAASAMVIPGLSGSMLLVLVGEYYNFLSFINNAVKLPLVVIGIGAIIGIISITKFINYMLNSHKNITIFFILGLIVASLFGIWPSFSATFKPTNILSLLFGITLVFFSKKLKKVGREHETV